MVSQQFNYKEILTYSFIPFAWQIEFFDADTAKTWYEEYHDYLPILRQNYPELSVFSDLQLVVAYEEYAYQLYGNLAIKPQRDAIFLGYLYFYAITQKRPNQHDLKTVQKLLPKFWKCYGSGKFITTR